MQRTLITLLFLCGLLSAVLVSAQNRDWDYRNNPNWDSSWNRRPSPRVGACFFTDRRFRGNRFCVSRGDRLGRLPGNFGDNISSVQIFGRSRVMIFNDRNFTGGSRELRSSVDDLRNVPFRGGRNTWNNRVSSIMVR
jgi:Peptidase inhibitor family I36